MKRISFFLAIVSVILFTSSGQAQVTKLLGSGAAVHADAAVGNVVGQTEYYGSGNEDAQAEYGVATFNYTPADFGAASISEVTQFEYTLTHHFRAFADGTEFALWLTTDDFDSTYSGISYDSSLMSGLDTNQFTNLSMLGLFPYDPASTNGSKEVLTIPLSDAQEADVVSQVNASSDFSIIITATSALNDVTFGGFDETFTPGGKPSLTISNSVPEPSTLGILAIVGLAGLSRRRRR